ncbi:MULTISPECIES: Uma2 family endonuclease [Thiothrix]|uniref:Uma2 family endonuclease n=2 Tax=Thiothrix TaxID=1030 RepID=A0AA51MNQ3_9GAMM|nr:MULTISPECIES: Uma2 family endonuclease [Thiothrix]MDQ5768863.1 Uma2 family endonuclease [Thiothrix subterranea]UJS26555.1 Uma2 family endonuclease [Thiothrix winogradskyi]WML86456.1 Uma2 family endonuclease [Thiothrix subterranea]
MSAAQQLQELYTYADYAKWPEGEHWELIDGVAYAMAAPSRQHQDVVLELGSQILQHLRGKPCRPYVAPFDVRLPRQQEADDKVDTTVQPDISVICERSKLDDKGCRGAPDWIIEVVSPSSAIMDMEKKRRLYERHGVKEYWIVHPSDRWLMVYTLGEDGKYGQFQLFGLDEPATVGLFPELSIDWAFLNDDQIG